MNGNKRSGDRDGSIAEPLPCVWMTAGLIAYRICDREYDCEHCPLDAALRGEDRQGASVEREEIASSDWMFPDDRRYHAGHLWSLPVCGDRLRCGVDAFAARLLPPIHSVIFPPAGSRSRRGRVTCWLRDDTELIPLRAPFDAIFSRGNPELAEHPTLIASSPYETGWLFDARRPAGDDGPSVSVIEVRRRSAEDLALFHELAARQLSRARSSVGPTLADGGQPLYELREMLGASRYARLIRRFLT